MAGVGGTAGGMEARAEHGGVVRHCWRCCRGILPPVLGPGLILRHRGDGDSGGGGNGDWSCCNLHTNTRTQRHTPPHRHPPLPPFLTPPQGTAAFPRD